MTWRVETPPTYVDTSLGAWFDETSALCHPEGKCGQQNDRCDTHQTAEIMPDRIPWGTDASRRVCYRRRWRVRHVSGHSVILPPC